MGSILGWLLSGGATAILGVASKGITSVAAPLSEAYATKQKALVDTHKIDADTSVALTTAEFNRENRQTELAAGLAEIDARNARNSWMRPFAFLISAYVIICAAIQYTFPALAKKIGLDVSTMPPIYVYFFLAVFAFIIGFRWYEKGSNASTVVRMQETVAKTPSPTTSWFGGVMKRGDAQ